MKNLLLGTALSIATAFAALPASAQGPGASGRGPEQGPAARGFAHGRGHGHGHRDPERRLERLRADLQLSDGQVARLRTIFRETKAEHEALGRGPENRDAHRAIRERSKQRVEAVLTPAQRARFAELREERRAARRHHVHGQGRGHGHGRGQGHGRGHGDCPEGKR